MKTSAEGIDLIASHEGFRATKYLCPAKKPTIGYGTMIDSVEEAYLLTATITKAEAKVLLAKDAAKCEAVIKAYVKVPLSQNQFDALVSFIYNVGAANFIGSGLLKKINSGASEESIRASFMGWNKGGGKVLPGLTKRRKEESDLFFN